MSFSLETMQLSGKEVLPLIEGGKGVAVSNGETTGAWAAAGGVGTFSAVNADSIDEDGNIVRTVYHGKSRIARFSELVSQGIAGGIAQAKVAHEVSGGNGRIHMNVLWEMGGAEQVLEGVLEGAKGLIHGVTCGAGMPFKLATLAAKHQVHYYPIISSSRAFRALWLRSYRKAPEWLGGVVYEDPWLAGGHNGLSNSEDPEKPQDPYPRVAELRKTMNGFGLENTPIVMAGGVWFLREWSNWINNPEIGPITFQFGTRPMLTQESPISDAWKQRLLQLKDGDIKLNKFSPTGFYSRQSTTAFCMNFMNARIVKSHLWIIRQKIIRNRLFSVYATRKCLSPNTVANLPRGGLRKALVSLCKHLTLRSFLSPLKRQKRSDRISSTVWDACRNVLSQTGRPMRREQQGVKPIQEAFAFKKHFRKLLMKVIRIHI